MGGRQTRQQPIMFNPTSAGFERVEGPTGEITWLNRLTGEELEEYQFLSNSERQFQYELDAFNFRHNNPFLVSSLYLRQEVQKEICGAVYTGNLFLERIPKRLSDLNEIPYPDVLHLYSQAFRGFNLLTRQIGVFNITQDMIGVNNSGVVKVWINSDFSKSLPERSLEIAGITEQVMVRRIIQVIHQNTHLPSMNSNIREFFEQRNPLTLEAAHGVLEEYATLNNARIPGRLDCYLEAFRDTLGKGVVRNVGSVVGTTVQHSVQPAVVQHPSIVGARPVSNINQTRLIRPPSAVRPPIITRPVTPIVAVPPIVSPRGVVVNTTTTNERPISAVRPIPVSTNARNVAFQARSLPLPTQGTISHNVVSTHAPTSVHFPARHSHVNFASTHQKHISPIRTQNVVNPLFPKVSPLRYSSIKPATAVVAPVTTIPAPAPIYRGVGQANHLFNRKIGGTTVLSRAPSQINFNSTYVKPTVIGATATKEYQSLIGSTPTSQPFSFQAPLARVEEVASANYNTTSEKTITDKYDFSSKYDYKPLTTQTQFQTTGTTLGGLSGRIQQLNEKYRFGGSESVKIPDSSIANNYSFSNYLPVTHANPATEIGNASSYRYEESLRTVGGTAFPTTHFKTDKYPYTTIEPISTGLNTYVTSQTTYQPANTFTNIVREERDVTYLPGEAIQSFAVERFAPTINTINQGSIDYTAGFTGTNQLASGYITNDYLRAGSMDHSYTPLDARYTAIREELYGNSAQPLAGLAGNYGYTSTHTESYESTHRGNGLTGFESVYETSRHAGSPVGMAYITTQAIGTTTPIAATYETETYYREETHSRFITTHAPQEYRINLDSDILNDLNKIRATGSIN